MDSPRNFVEFYNQLWELRDKRVDGWFLMDSIWPTIILCVLYWYCMMVLGPYLMKNRAPFELKMPMQIYNVAITLLSAYMCYEVCMSGWFRHYNWLCQEIETDPDPKSPSMRMAAVTHIYFLSKFIEFLDTIFFILRKKFRNVSNLQLIHHGLMPFYCFLLVRWVPGGHETFLCGLNSCVHVVMYSYYFLAALGSHMQPYLWWKKYLTMFQIIQLSSVLVKNFVVIFGVASCGYPWQFSFLTAMLMILFLGLFTEFYIQEYTARAAREKSAQKNQ